MTTGKPPTPKIIYASLAGNVETQMVQRIFGAFSIAINEGVETVHLLIQSIGGVIGDGVGIYNYLRKLPLNIIAYNGGQVSSVAVLIFLAAKQRKASRTATFMIHKTHFTAAVPTNANVVASVTNMLKIDDGRVEEILHEHIKMPADKWKLHAEADLTLTASEALEYKLIHEIADFEVPPGNQLYNLNA